MFVLFIRSIAPSDPKKLILRLQQMLGIELHPSTMKTLRYTFKNQIDDKIPDPLSIEDIQQHEPRVKYLPLVFYAEGIPFLYFPHPAHFKCLFSVFKVKFN
jgi:hypothetical protein